MAILWCGGEDIAFSQNPDWQILDLLIDYWIKPRQLVNAALTTGEKVKIDFASFASAAAYADEVITVNGVDYIFMEVLPPGLF